MNLLSFSILFTAAAGLPLVVTPFLKASTSPSTTTTTSPANLVVIPVSNKPFASVSISTVFITVTPSSSPPAIVSSPGTHYITVTPTITDLVTDPGTPNPSSITQTGRPIVAPFLPGAGQANSGSQQHTTLTISNALTLSGSAVTKTTLESDSVQYTTVTPTITHVVTATGLPPMTSLHAAAIAAQFFESTSLSPSTSSASFEIESATSDEETTTTIMTTTKTTSITRFPATTSASAVSASPTVHANPQTSHVTAGLVLSVVFSLLFLSFLLLLILFPRHPLFRPLTKHLTFLCPSDPDSLASTADASVADASANEKDRSFKLYTPTTPFGPKNITFPVTKKGTALSPTESTIANANPAPWKRPRAALGAWTVESPRIIPIRTTNILPSLPFSSPISPMTPSPRSPGILKSPRSPLSAVGGRWLAVAKGVVGAGEVKVVEVKRKRTEVPKLAMPKPRIKVEEC